jgi:hypothetical protein
METLGDKIMPKLCPKFYCSKCDYGTSKRSSYNNHIVSAKHIKPHIGDAFGDIGDTNSAKIMPSNKTFVCDGCNKSYLSRNGLWKHNKLCKIDSNVDTEENIIIGDNKISEKDLIMLIVKQNTELIKENNEFKNMMMEVIKNGTNSNSHNNTISNNNSHNKAFNLQFFLNETCKDAMNITDFVESIKLQLSDLENVAEVGYVEGISDIIVKNLKKLDVTQRPVHCTDKKRETMYVKDEDTWEKDEENKQMHKVVKKVTDKNARLILKYKEAHPDCMTYHSRFNDKYNKIIVESMGGSGDNMFEKEEKIIQRVSKNVTVDKETL